MSYNPNAHIKCVLYIYILSCLSLALPLEAPNEFYPQAAVRALSRDAATPKTTARAPPEPMRTLRRAQAPVLARARSKI